MAAAAERTWSWRQRQRSNSTNITNISQYKTPGKFRERRPSLSTLLTRTLNRGTTYEPTKHPAEDSPDTKRMTQSIEAISRARELEALTVAHVAVAPADPFPLVTVVTADASHADDAMRYTLKRGPAGGAALCCSKRYSQWLALHDALPVTLRPISAPFPPKRFHFSFFCDSTAPGGTKDPTMGAERAVALEAWVSELLNLPGALDDPAVGAFISLPSL